MDPDVVLAAYVSFSRSPEGQTILEDLRRRTVARGVMPAEACDGIAMGMHMALREGENTLFRYIENKINQGKQGNVGKRSDDAEDGWS